MRYTVTFRDLPLDAYMRLLAATEGYSGPAPEIAASEPSASAVPSAPAPSPHTPHSGPANLGKG